MKASFHYGQFRAVINIQDMIPTIYISKPMNGFNEDTISYDFSNHEPLPLENLPQGKLVFNLHDRPKEGEMPEYWFYREEA